MDLTGGAADVIRIRTRFDRRQVAVNQPHKYSYKQVEEDNRNGAALHYAAVAGNGGTKTLGVLKNPKEPRIKIRQASNKGLW